MSTQFDTSIVDLDRTDELPVLDVEAYEASLAAQDKTLSRTDIWAVEDVRAIDEPEDEVEDVVAWSVAAKPSAQSEAVTTNVEQILKRIADLEAEIVSTHEANARLLKDCESLRAERTQSELRIGALQADNARLCTDRAKHDEIKARFEQQLGERAECISTLEVSISNEQDISAHLSRQLAAKLMECEKAVSTIELRNRTIEDLTREGTNLDHRLQQELATSADLTARLAAAEQSMHESRALLLERDKIIEDRDAQLMQAQSQIQSLTEERDALRSAAAQFDARAADVEQKDAELAQLFDELVGARAEVQRQAQLLNDRNEELGRLHARFNERETAIRGLEHAARIRSEETADLRMQLQAALDERVTIGMQLDKARAREKNLTDQIFSRNSRIVALEADLAVHTEALATIRRDVNRIGASPGTDFDEVEHLLEPIEHDGPTLYLTREVLTVGRTNDNDITIPSTLVSRCHARLLVGPTGVVIEDANSMNGCYVNGERVRQHLLHEGDVLELGDKRYRLRTRPVRDVKGVDNQDNLPRLSSAGRRRTSVRMAN